MPTTSKIILGNCAWRIKIERIAFVCSGTKCVFYHLPLSRIYGRRACGSADVSIVYCQRTDVSRWNGDALACRCSWSIHNGEEINGQGEHSICPFSSAFANLKRNEINRLLQINYWGVRCAILIIILNAVNSHSENLYSKADERPTKYNKRFSHYYYVTYIYERDSSTVFFSSFLLFFLGLFSTHSDIRNIHFVMCEVMNGWPFGLHRFAGKMNSSHHRIQQYIY